MGLLAIILSVLVGGFAEFDKTVCDFGTFSIKDGPQSCVFTVRNNGTDDMCIFSVTTSCSCIRTAWTREIIKPGQIGEIQVTYNNDEGPYPFDKVMSVYLKDVKKPVTLHVRGNVTNKKIK